MVGSCRDRLRRSTSAIGRAVTSARTCSNPTGEPRVALRFLLDTDIVSFHSQESSRPLQPLDLMIAAHALTAGVTPLTNNTPEFTRVPGLRCKDWTR